MAVAVGSTNGSNSLAPALLERDFGGWVFGVRLQVPGLFLLAGGPFVRDHLERQAGDGLLGVGPDVGDADRVLAVEPARADVDLFGVSAVSVLDQCPAEDGSRHLVAGRHAAAARRRQGRNRRSRPSVSRTNTSRACDSSASSARRSASAACRRHEACLTSLLDLVSRLDAEILVVAGPAEREQPVDAIGHPDRVLGLLSEIDRHHDRLDAVRDLGHRLVEQRPDPLEIALARRAGRRR